MKKDFAEHQGTWAVKTPAAYQQDRVDERTCEICNFHEVKTVPDTALTLKPRTITVTKSEFIYNTRPYELNDYIVSEDKAGLKVEYRKKEQKPIRPSHRVLLAFMNTKSPYLKQQNMRPGKNR